MRLLLLEQAEQPDHPFTLFNLGMSYLDLKRPADALPLLERSLARSDSAASIVRKLHYMIVQCHRQLGQPAEALAACRRGRSSYAEDAELLSQEGQLHAEQGNFASAESCYLQLLDHAEAAHFFSAPIGLNGYLTRHNLAVLYHQHGRLAEAEAQWRAALAERPDFNPALFGLAEVFLAQARWPELEEIHARLGGVDAAVLGARVHLANQQYAAGRRLLEEAVARAPHLLWPRVVLSHALLQEGRDYPAAERTLHDRLDPSHAEARHNLEVLRRDKRQATAAAPGAS